MYHHVKQFPNLLDPTDYAKVVVSIPLLMMDLNVCHPHAVNNVAAKEKQSRWN